MRSCFAVAALFVLGCVVDGQDSSLDSHDSHEEEGDWFEAAAVYGMEDGINSFIVTPAEGTFTEETLAFMVVPADSVDADGLSSAQGNAEAGWDAFVDGAEEPTVLASGEPVVPSAAAVYQVALLGRLVLVPVEIGAAGAAAVFLQHGSAEAVVTLASPSGVVLAAAAVEGGDDGGEDSDDTGGPTTSQWANALAASFIVFCSFTGLLVIVNKRVADNIGLSHAFIFASGALLTASLLHIIPEAIEGLGPEYENRLHETGLYAMLFVLGGISFGILVHALTDSWGGDPRESSVGAGTGDSAVSGTNQMPSGRSLSRDRKAEKAPAPGRGSSFDGVPGVVEGDPCAATRPPPPPEALSHNLRALIVSRSGRAMTDVKGLQPVCWNVVAGDLIHNLVDGATIGAAFLRCTTAMGWTVTASAVLHEIPHELAGFMALLNGGMSVKQAFLHNFLSALSAALGAIVILSLGDTLTDAQISITLLLGAGSFIFIALAELLPEVLPVAAAMGDRGSAAVGFSQLRKLASFFLGALVIGIPLIFDQHCSSTNGHDP